MQNRSDINLVPGKHFTLIELLVVLGIIIILASLLFPALNNVRTKLSETECQNNQKETYAAQMSFSGDHNNQGLAMGISRPTSGGSSAWYGWETPLWQMGYLGSENLETGLNKPLGNVIYSCPLSEFEKQKGWNSAYKHTQAYGINSTGTTAAWYSMSNYLKTQHYKEEGSTTHTLSTINIGRIPKMSETAFIMDSQSKWGRTAGWGTYQISKFGDDDSGMIWLRHSGKANVTFFDGHVQQLDEFNYTDYIRSVTSFSYDKYKATDLNTSN